MASIKCSEFKKYVARLIFQGDETAVSDFYLGLGTGALPAVDDTLADITEVTGTGYARVQLSRGLTDFPTLAATGDDWKVTAVAATFAASGTWTGADFLFICDVASGTAGRLFAAITLDAPFLLLSGESYDAILEYLDD